MTVVIRLIGLASRAIVTPHDGRFLVDYDPTWRAEPHRFGLMVEKLATSPRIEDAKRFASAAEAKLYRAQVCPNRPREANGAINRPLTAFVIELINPRTLEAHREAVNEPFSPRR